MAKKAKSAVKKATRTESVKRRIKIKKIRLPFLEPIFRPVKKGLSFIIPSFLKNAWKEIKQVTWPNRHETIRLTTAVFIFSVVFGAMVWLLDLGLDKVFKELIIGL